MTLELPPLGAKPLLLKRSCGALRLMWSGGIVRRHAGECWGQGGVCAHVSVCACADQRGDGSQRAAGTDVWLPLTVHSGRGWSAEGAAPGPPLPRHKGKRRFDRCEFCSFCAQRLETCSVRNLTFGESQSLRSESESTSIQTTGGGTRVHRWVGGWDEQCEEPSCAPASFDTTN